jgi:hypothetical protein
LFEFLLRQITSDVISNDTKTKAAKIVKKRFNENTELGKELALYNILINKKFSSDKKANYFITEVVESRKKLNNSILKRERYKLFEYSNLSPDDKTESFFNIVEHVTTKDDNIKLSETVNTLPNDEDLRLLTYRTLLEKFNSKYKKLNYPQKSLLRAYINNVSNVNSLKEYLQKVVPVIKKDLSNYFKNVQDEVVKIKLKEAINSINKFCSPGKTELVKDNVVVQTMRYMELLKELKKSGNKNKKKL